ncbi:TonB-dependent receptor [Chitinophagaceae bacterium MMS25-I14]
MKYPYILLSGILLPITVLAQNGLTGKITDAFTHKPLPGATIYINNPGASTTTGKDGAFTIACDEGSELTISLPGYQAKKQPIRDCGTELDITLTPVNNDIDEVEITATSGTNKSVLYQPQSIARLGIKELKRGNGLYMDDAINTNVPGVMMERRSISGGQEFNIRGYGNGVGARGASNNFDGQGYKVYLNGIPVTDAEGITLMDDIDFASIGKAEVIKGPAGTLYGLAIAGVVNLSTIQPEKGTVTIGQDALLGSYGLQRYTTHLQIGGDHSSLLINYGHQSSDGFETHTASHKDFVNTAGTFDVNQKQTVTTYFSYSHSYDQRGGELTIDQYNKGDYSGNPVYIKNNAHSEIISFRAGVSSNYTFNNHFSNTTTVFGSGVSNNSSSAAGWTDKDPINYGARTTLDVKYNLGSNYRISGISGVEAQQQYAQIIGYGMTADSSNLTGYNKIGAMKSNQAARTGTASVFTEWTLAMPHDISVTAGIGWSMMDILLNDRFYVANSKNATSYGTTYNNMFSPHIAVNKVFSKQLSVYASYSKGYKAPVSANIFIPVTNTINTGLKPEIGNQYEIGSKGELVSGRLFYTLALFNAHFSNKMTSVAVPLNGTTTAYTYTANGGSQDDKGIEALVKYKIYESPTGFIHTVEPFANFCYSYFRYKDFRYQTLDAQKNPATADYSGKAVAGVPPVTANAGIDILSRYGFYGNVAYSYRDAMPISSDGANKTNSFSLLYARIGIRHTVLKRFSVDAFFGADNITSQKYYTMVFINQLPDAYLPAPDKINYYGGISLKYTIK